MALNDYTCLKCKLPFEALTLVTEKTVKCPHCGSKKVKKQFPLIGGYQMQSGPASIRPRQAGAFKGKSIK